MPKNQNSTFEIFKFFSKKEMNDLKKFLKVPYFNQSKIIFELFNEIKEYHPDELSNGILKKINSLPSFVKRNYSEKQLRDFVYRLNKIALEFMKFKAFKNDEILNEETLLEMLLNKRMNNIFKKRFYLVEKLISNQKSINNYYNEYKIKSLKFNFDNFNGSQSNKLKGEDLLKKIEHCSQILSKYYYFEIISNYVTYIIDCRSFNIDHTKSNFFDDEHIETIYSKIKEYGDGMIELYYLLFKTYSDSDIKFYLKYKKLFIGLFQELSLDERKYHYENLYKFCSLKKASLDDSIDFNKELLKLYNHYIQNKYYKMEGRNYIGTVLLINVIKLSAEFRDFRMVKEFFKNNSRDVNPKDLNIVSVFLNAYENFATGNFNRSLLLINKIKFTHYSFKYEIRMLRIKNLYEMIRYEEVLMNISSFKEFLKADKFLSFEVKKTINDFLKYLSALIKYEKKSDREYHLYELKKNKKVSNKNWLIEKYESSDII